MASSRCIRQNFFNHPLIAQKYDIDERYLLIGLAAASDDFGRFWYNLSNIKSTIFPTDDNITIEWIKGCIDKLISHSVLCNYIIDDVEYLHFPLWFSKGWFLKQRIDHPREFRFPDCPVCKTEQVKREKMEKKTRKFADNTIKANSIKDNTIKTKLNNDQSILDRFNDRIVRDNLLSRYPLLDISQYNLILKNYILALNDYNMNEQDHERLFEIKLKEAHEYLEKEAA